MAILNREAYLYLLSKTAEEVSSVPEIDNQDIGVAEQRHSTDDSRKTLGNLFSGFAAAEKANTSAIKKLLPGSHPDAASSPLLKLASYPFLEAMKSSFLAELEKIATNIPGVSGVLPPGTRGSLVETALKGLRPKLQQAATR
jgi:hypothetical protein